MGLTLEPQFLARNETGALSLPLVLIIALTLTTGLGIWGCLRNWRGQAETQLRLNRCVGEAALEFRDTLSSLESKNEKVIAIRAAIASASLVPGGQPAAAGLKAALTVLVIAQDIILTKWKVKAIKWIALPCGKLGDLPGKLPSLGYHRPPPDMIGPRELVWRNQPKAFYFSVTHLPRTAAAEVRGSHGRTLSGSSWTAEWSSPEKFKRSNRP